MFSLVFTNLGENVECYNIDCYDKLLYWSVLGKLFFSK